MGNASFLAIAAMAILTAALTVNAVTSSIATTDGQSRDQQSLQAEEIARSGLDMTVARVSRDFSTWREGFPETVYGGGSFMTTVDGPAEGPVRVYSAGVVDGVDVQLTAWVTKLANAPSAMTVESDSVRVSMSSAAVISGVDHDADGAEGRGQAEAARGVWASSPSAATAFTNALSSGSSSRVRGVGSAGDVHEEALPGEHGAMLAEAEAAATDTFSGDQTFTAQTFGSAASPAVVVVDGDATFAGGGGTGFLYVKGDFEARGDFEWRGIVVAEAEGDMGFTMRDHARIHGASYVLHGEGGNTDWSMMAPSPLLSAVPYSARNGAHPTRTVTWTDFGTVRIEATTTTTGGGSSDRSGRVRGSTLQEFAAQADISGVSLDPGGVTNVEYLGPSEMPLLRIEPVTPRSGDGDGTSEVRLTLDNALPAGQPLYVYVLDMDVADMFVTAYDAAGNRLPTGTWTKSQSIDLVVPDDGNRTTMTSGGDYVRLRPWGGGDSETIIDEITIPDAGAVRELRFAWSSRFTDYAGIALTTDVLFGKPGVLDVEISDNAGVRYSAEDIAALAGRIASIEDRSWIEVYDYHATSQVDRMTLARRGTGAGTSQTTYAYCLGGTTGTAPSLMGLLAVQLEGATAGACASGSGMVTVCHMAGTPAERTQSIGAEGLEAHLSHGDTAGACAPASTPDPDDLVTVCHRSETRSMTYGDATSGRHRNHTTLGACLGSGDDDDD